MHTGEGDDVDRTIGLELDADDHLGKPFNPRELLARIRTVLRRTQPEPSDGEQLRVGVLLLHFGTREARLPTAHAVRVRVARRAGARCRPRALPAPPREDATRHGVRLVRSVDRRARVAAPAKAGRRPEAAPPRRDALRSNGPDRRAARSTRPAAGPSAATTLHREIGRRFVTTPVAPLDEPPLQLECVQGAFTDWSVPVEKTLSLVGLLVLIAFVVRPIGRLIEASRRFSDGELSTRVAKPRFGHARHLGR